MPKEWLVNLAKEGINETSTMNQTNTSIAEEYSNTVVKYGIDFYKWLDESIFRGTAQLLNKMLEVLGVHFSLSAEQTAMLYLAFTLFLLTTRMRAWMGALQTYLTFALGTIALFLILKAMGMIA